MGTLAAALVGLRNRKTVGELKRFRQTSALHSRVGIPMWSRWSADRAGFPDCKTTQPRLRGALYVWFTSNTSTQQLGHSFVEPKFVFRFLLRFQKCSCFTAYLGHDERTNSLKLKAISGTLTSAWGIPAGWPPENSLFDKQHMGFLYLYEEDDKRVVVPGLGD